MNTLDYIKEVQYDDLYDRPYGEIDYLLLAELSYLPFDDLVSSSFAPQKATRLVELAPKIPKDSSADDRALPTAGSHGCQQAL